MSDATLPPDAATPPAAPSPYESMRPAGESAPRVASHSGRFHGVTGWFLNDVGLKVVSLLVAAMMWQLVRGRIQVETTVDVDVELVALEQDVRVARAERVRAVTLQLAGTRSEVERVRSDLVKNRRIAYRFTADAGRSGRVGPVTDPTRLDYPVEDAKSVVTKIETPIEATWYRVVTRKVKLDPPLAPPVRDRPDVDVDVPTMNDTEVTITAPVSVLERMSGARIRPDRIDVRQYLEFDFAAPFSFESGFDDWRAEDPTLRGTDLTLIEPPRVKGKVLLRQRPSKAFENTLRPLPATNLDDLRDVSIEIRARGYDATTRMLSAELRGDARVLDQMKREPQSWSFVVALPPPPSPTDPPTKVEAEVSLWFEKEPPSSVKLSGKTTVSVTLTRKK